MSLNNIQLQASLITQLFRHSLVTSDREKSEPEKLSATKTGYPYLGKNLKKIALIVNSPEAHFLPDADLLLLTKMLEACKLNIADVAILNHHANPVHIAALNEQLSPKQVLLFGLEPTAIKLPFTIPLFKIQEYNNCSYLYSPPLLMFTQDTEEGKLLKSKLWLCLKKLFEV